MYKAVIGLDRKKTNSVIGYTYEYPDCKWCLLSEDGEQLTPNKYTFISNFKKGLAIVQYLPRLCDRASWGYINEKGEEIFQLVECVDSEDFECEIKELLYQYFVKEQH